MADIQDVVQAKKFQIVDDSGQVRAELGMFGGDGVEFILRDREGTPQLQALVSDHGYSLRLGGDWHEPSVTIDVLDGSPSLTLNEIIPSPDSNRGISMGIRDEGVYLDLFNEGRFEVELNEIGKPTLTLADKEMVAKDRGTRLTTGGVKKNQHLWLDFDYILHGK